MNSNLDKSREILNKVKSGKASNEEMKLVYHWWLINHPEQKQQPSDEELERDLEEIWNSLSIHKKRFNRVLFYRVAACVFLAAAFSLYWFSDNFKTENNTEAPITEIFAGGNHAILRLSDGRTYNLAPDQNGIVVDDGITYLDGSALGGENVVSTADLTKSTQFELVTPKGGTFMIVLPDGTEVWLNAESKLTYPQTFAEKERRVRLEGEAYFAVRENQQKPFVVESAMQTVRVLGTAFNISAYRHEPTITTLIEGSVALSSIGSSASATLVPNQQAVFDDNQFNMTTVETDPFTSWKNGFFRFKNEDIHSVMQKLERWYDVKVTYKGTPPTDLFNGKISRSKSLKHVLRMLEKTGTVNFEIEIDENTTERRVIIM